MEQRVCGMSLLGWCLTLLVGCGQSTYPVEGTVVMEGENAPTRALKGYEVSLRSVDRPVGAYGPIQEDGTFQVGTFKPNDGAIPGNHKVAITPPVGETGDSPRVRSILDPKYESFDNSGLEIEVKPEHNKVTLTVKRRKR